MSTNPDTHYPEDCARPKEADLVDALRRAFSAGWEANKTGNASHPEGREISFRMFLRGFNFGDDDVGEDLTIRRPIKARAP
jgi:hypothetical protein